MIFPLFMVSSTGKLDLAFLQQADTTTNNRVPHSKTLTKCAQSARARLRYAESLQRRIHLCGRQLSEKDVKLVADLQSGKLLYEANQATRKAGWGRIKHLDGTFEDITPNGGGIVRSILDNVPVGKQGPDPDMRLAFDGNLYTRQEFIDWYSHCGESMWARAPRR